MKLIELYFILLLTTSCNQSNDGSNTILKFDESTLKERNYVVLQLDKTPLYKHAFRFIFNDYDPDDSLSITEIINVEKIAIQTLKSHKNELMELSRYKMQFVPLLNKMGDRIVWVNCFCNPLDNDWQHRILNIHDGGKCYFEFKINLLTNKYFDFAINGNG